MKKQWAALLLVLLIILGFLFSFSRIFVDGSITGSSLEGSIDIRGFGDYTPERILIPLKVHLVKEPRFEHFTTTRDGEDVTRLITEANRIWEQAGIYFSIEEIVISEIQHNTIPQTLKGNATQLYLHENFAYDKINIFLTHDLNGINGLALRPINSALVTDFTTVNDYRTTAHELGHLLELGHVSPENRLMARGKNGELLTEEEIMIARENALQYT
jgi:hypothetical protein